MKADDDDDVRRRVAAAYDEVLHEPVPERLKRLLDAPAPVVDLAAERARRRAPAHESRWPRASAWMQWGGMAASLAIGVVAGALLASRGAEDSLLMEHDGDVRAGAPLAQALDSRLASESPAHSGVAVQLSFLDRAGRYCRTFSAEAIAGLACREGGGWHVVATAQAPATNTSAMRQAASSLPKPVLAAVDARIAGNALDAAQERAARDGGWKR
jgi:hypothetical protein